MNDIEPDPAANMEVANGETLKRSHTDEDGLVTVPKKFATRPRVANNTAPLATHKIYEDLPIDPEGTGTHEGTAGPARTVLLRPPPFINPTIAAASLKPQCFLEALLASLFLFSLSTRTLGSS